MKSVQSIADDELSLDPEDWSAMRALGHRMVDDMCSYLETVRERRVWQPVPTEIRERLRSGPPDAPLGAAKVYDEFLRLVLPYPHGNIHPRYWGWVTGTGTPLGMFADLLAAGMNSHVGFGDQSATHVEEQLLGWFREIFRFPADGSGVVVSGCTVANLTALTVARNCRAGIDVRRLGVRSFPEPVLVYGTSESHTSIVRALEVLGLGRDSLRCVPTDTDYRMRPDSLREMVSADQHAGARPIAVVATAGTTNTGSIDDLQAIADVCAEFGLWLHVDGAFGALLALVPDLRARLAGIERADSLAFDLHKWLHVPYDAGVALFRSSEAQRASFSLEAAYLSRFETGVSTGPANYMERGLQLSRSFRALKAWMTIKEHGFTKLGRVIEQNVDQATYLAELVDRSPELERLAGVPLNIVCFRYVAPGLSQEELDELNAALLRSLHNDGIAVPSHTRIAERFAIRVAITNHRSRRADFELLTQEVTNRGRKIAETMLRARRRVLALPPEETAAARQQTLGGQQRGRGGRAPQ
jgi:glutamate/tyrosine decarboxylase-like PLP-dependent enzyme